MGLPDVCHRVSIRRCWPGALLNNDRYLNGSILIASIESTIDPKQDAKFTILHTLTTARAPSPIVNLAWHASSTKQKSDMLASQTMDGDLRVWSVAKPPTAEVPKTIRILKRMDNVEPGRHWCSWSKNGRVLQFSDRYVGFFSLTRDWPLYQPID